MSGGNGTRRRKNRLYRWIAAMLTVALLTGQCNLTVLAQEETVPLESEVPEEEKEDCGAGDADIDGGRGGDTDGEGTENGNTDGTDSAGSSAENDRTDDAAENGATDDGAAENGTTDDGTADNGNADDSAADNSSADNGGAENGTVDNDASGSGEVSDAADDPNQGNIGNDDGSNDREANDGEGNKDTESGDTEEPDECICETVCTEGQVNEECPVCAVDYTACAQNAGEEEEIPAETVSGNELEDEGIEVPAEDAATYAAWNEFEDDNGIKYKIIANGQVEVIGHKNGESVTGELVIPATVNNGDVTYSVIRIGEFAFYDYGGLSSIELPDSVTSIEDYAFGLCTGLGSIDLPDSIASIGAYAFQSCTGLSNIKLPNSLTSIKTYTFQECSGLRSIKFPDSLTSIGVCAFQSCTSLRSLEIPSSVTEIGLWAFEDCQKLDSVKMPASVMSIGDRAFCHCTSLTLMQIVIVEGETAQPPTVDRTAFDFGPADRGIIVFVAEDGSDVDLDVLKASQEAYKSDARDGNADDNLWWGWKIGDVFKITYHLDDDYKPSLSDCYYISGDGRTLPIPEKPGFTFDGWYRSEDCSGDRVTAVGPEETGDKEFYGRWIEDTYAVNVIVNKDIKEWNDHGRKFMLRPEGGETLKEIFDDFDAVPAGTYAVYDVTDLTGNSPTEDMNTGRLVKVGKAETNTVTVDYYTVTFYDGDKAYSKDTEQAPKIVLEGKKISKPENPAKEYCTFAGWVDKGNNDHDFKATVNGTTDIYASWTYSVKVTVKKDDKEWKDHGRKFILQPEDGEALKEPFEEVPAGTYAVYDVTDLKAGDSPTEAMNTRRSIKVENAGIPNTVEIDYYTAAFYDENSDNKKLCQSGTEQNPQIILKEQCAGRPTFVPTKDKYAFAGWVTADGTEFDFDGRIGKPTEIYASWEKIEEPRYKVTINVWKDGGAWKNSGRIFALRQESGDEETVFDLAQVKKGTYRVYDITGDNPVSYRFRAVDTVMDVKVDDGDTGVTLTVENKDETAAVDYYTVTFYDGKKAYGTDTPQSPMIVLSGKRATQPPAPDKTGYEFIGWKIEDGGSTAYNFNQAIRNKTDIYAEWEVVKSTTGKGRKPGGKTTPDNGDGTGDTQTVMVWQEASPQAGISQPGSMPVSDKMLPGDKEPKTGDIIRVEIYATMTMISGLMYLFSYFRDEGRGMTEREKEVFVAAFIRWAKKGGIFRRCCALVAIFFILVYYHSIGKRANKNNYNRVYLKQALYKEYR